MADNCIFLCHRPSKMTFMLGKRYDIWYCENKNLDAFYKAVYEWSIINNESNDDFELLIEDGRNAPKCNADWVYCAPRLDETSVIIEYIGE